MNSSIPDDFNYIVYKYLNIDLQEMNENQCRLHYLNHGIKENRKYKFDIPADFNYIEYKYLNNDLKDMNEDQCKLHYLNHGIIENRKYKLNVPSDFNFIEYMYLNTDLDLEEMNEIDCKFHYLNYGMKKSRKYKLNVPNDFNYIEYKYLNKDLEDMNEFECKLHYLNNGIIENRIYKLNIVQDFNYIEYMYLNSDLEEMSEFQCKLHYLDHGIKEYRKYKLDIPADFNYIEYKYLNNDLNEMNEFQCKLHYLDYGIKENRKYKFDIPYDFNYNDYKFFNNDLNDYNELECKDHYYNNGIKEFRKYGHNLLEDFDYNEYKFLNKNLDNMNKNECIEHYLKFGYNKYENYNRIYLIKLFVLYNFNNDTLNIDISTITDTQINNFKNSIKNITSISMNELEIYIMIINYYKLITKKDEDTYSLLNFDNIYNIIIKNKKEHFRYLCYRNINYIKNKKINIDYNLNNHNETVFIEFRILYNVEFNIRNICNQLPTWKHTIICGNDNYDFIKKICNDVSLKINIIRMNKNNISVDEYSQLLASSEFWNLLTGKHILIHQEDSLLFDSKYINTWLKYDYVGAPWPKDIYDYKYLVGNGGFSLRKRETMIYICKNYDINNYEIFNFTKEYMSSNNLNVTPEDCFFVKCMVDNNIGILPSYEKAQFFSTESINCLDSLGGHCFWLNDKKWINRFNIIIKQFSNIGIKYIKEYNHRYGWNNLLMTLYINDIITLYNKNNNIELIDLSEKFFMWKNNRISRKWVGIVHITPYTPKYLNNLNINELFHNINFNDAMKYCVKLITLSNYLKIYIKNNINNNIKINKINHPIKKVTKFFSIDEYLNNDNKYIIHIGQRLRIFKTFFNLKFTTHNKLLISNNIDNLLNNLNKEMKIRLKSYEELSSYLSNYNIIYKNLNNNDYDDLIIKNIIFIHLYDSSANNILIEAIIHKTPIIINKNPAIIEYLGIDYPLYYSDISELNDDFINNNKIIYAYNYLDKYDTSKFMYKNFCEELLENMNE